MVPPSLNLQRTKYRNHHAYGRIRDTWRKMIWALVPASDRVQLVIAGNLGRKLLVEIHITHKKLFDKDNLHGSVKPVLDCLKPTKMGKRGKVISTGLGFIADDDPGSIELEVTQSIGPDVGTRITISEARTFTVKEAEHG